MTTINILNSSFESSDSLDVSIDLSVEQVSVPSVHQVVKATLASRRQGNASVKNRSEVRGGGAKPFKQKGTGRARQGSTRSSIMVGGGVAFGPQKRDFTQKLNKKMVNKAIHSVIADKFQSGKLFVVDTLSSNGKTKEINKLLTSKGLLPALVVTTSNESMVLRATRNIEKAKAVPVSGFSVYESVKFENLVIEKAALEKLFERLV